MYSLRSVVLALCILMAAQPAISAPSPYAGLTITGIVLKDDLGNPWLKPEQIMPLIGLKPGDGYSGQAIRDGISLLYLKGLFRDIRVEAFREQGGVRLEYTFFPVTVVDRIVVRGNHALSTTVITDALPTVTGKELREDKLPALRGDIIALYQADGYFETTVSFHPEQLAEPHRVALFVYIVEGAPTTIGEIAFTGNTVFKDKSLLAVMKSRAGLPLKRDQLLDQDKEAILEKYTDAGYPVAKAGPVDINFRDHKAYVHIIVDEGPRLTVRFTGNRGLSTSKLKQALLFSSEHDLSDSVIESSTDRIRTLYREKGYADVMVDVKKTAAPAGLDLDFSINEGPKVKVKSIVITGNTAFTAKAIEGQMGLQAPGWSWSWTPVPFYWHRSFPFRQDLLDKDVDNIHDRYLEAGYLATAVKSAVARSADGRQAFVKIEITEGPRTLTGAVTLEGNTVFTSEELLNKLSLKPGDPYNERLLDEDRYGILTAYSNKGYLYARVDVDRTPRDGTMDLRYHISEDKQVRIGRIILRGNERTKDYVIMRELLVKPGDPYNYGDILTSQQRIYHLGYIRLAKFEPIHPGEKEYIQDMLLTIEERPAGAVEFGLGYGDLDRLRGFVEISYRNLWGTAKYTSLRFEESDILKRAIFNFQEPWFLDRKLEAKFSLVWSDSERLNSDTRELYYKSRSTSASFGVEKSYEKLKPSLTYQFENVVNYDVRKEAQITPEDTGRVLVSSLSPALILDLRDDVFNPRRGALYGIIVKEALREFFSEADFSKITVQASWFLPIDNAVAAFSARAGMAWPFRSTLKVPLHERFYTGGGTTVRGYTQDSIGPQPTNEIPQGGASMAVFNAELRLNPGEGLGFVLFTDAGNVWSSQQIDLKNLRASYGVGIRYGTPVGPLRLDYGQKIDPKFYESPGEVHFNISNTF